MKTYILFSFNALEKIYKEGAYCSVVMPTLLDMLDERDRRQVTRLVYGVLNRHEEFSFMLRKLCKKQPRPSVRIALRMGMYMLKYMNSVPDHAAVNECVELVKTFKKEQAGFVNATLKQYIALKNELPAAGAERLAVETNRPMWLLDRLTADYGSQAAMVIAQSNYKHTHLRISTNNWSEAAFFDYAEKNGIKYRPTQYGFIIGSTESVKPLLTGGKATLQALDSIIICRALCPEPTTENILDLCAAPGGKSVYLAEFNPNATVIACDVHEHRVELIRAYARRMKAKVLPMLSDGTVFRADWENAFDRVLVDAPCSGVGVLPDNPDIIINRTEADLVAITELQGRLLENACRYVKNGGILVYATCSNLKAENENIIYAFLAKHSEFALEPTDKLPGGAAMYTFTNDVAGNDGFFAARLIKRQ